MTIQGSAHTVQKVGAVVNGGVVNLTQPQRTGLKKVRYMEMTIEELASKLTSECEIMIMQNGVCVDVVTAYEADRSKYAAAHIDDFRAYCFRPTFKVTIK